jgi:hypothetical protein
MSYTPTHVTIEIKAGDASAKINELEIKDVDALWVEVIASIASGHNLTGKEKPPTFIVIKTQSAEKQFHECVIRIDTFQDLKVDAEHYYAKVERRFLLRSERWVRS